MKWNTAVCLIFISLLPIRPAMLLRFLSIFKPVTDQKLALRAFLAFLQFVFGATMYRLI